MNQTPPFERSALANIGWLSVERGARIVLQIVTAVVVIRYLGPSDFGIVVTVDSVTAILVSIQLLGLDPLVMEATDHPDLSYSRRVLNTAILSRALVGLPIAIGLVGAALIVENSDIATGLVFAIAVVASAPMDTFRLAQDARRESRTYVQRRVLIVVLHVIGQIALVLASADVVIFLAINVSAAAAHLLVGAFPLPPAIVERSFDTGLLRRAAPLLMATMASTIYRRIDIVMITGISGVEEAGLYGAASRIAELPFFIAVAIATTYFLAMRDDRTLGNRGSVVLQDTTALVTGVISPLVIGLMAGAPLLPVLLGEEFRDSVPMLMIYSPSVLFISWGVLRHRWLVLNKLERHSAIAASSGAVVNIGLNAALIPLAGGVGAAIATLVSYGGVMYVYSLIVPACRPAATAIHRSIAQAPRAIRELFSSSRSQHHERS